MTSPHQRQPTSPTPDRQWMADVETSIWGVRGQGGLVNEVRGLRDEFRQYRKEERERREDEAAEKNRATRALAFALLSAFIAALTLIVSLGLYVATGGGP